jgi:hypothetical protein
MLEKCHNSFHQGEVKELLFFDNWNILYLLTLFYDFKSAYNPALFGTPTHKNVALISISGNFETKYSKMFQKRKKTPNVCKCVLTLNEPATTGCIMDRVELKLDITSDQ